MEHIRRRIVPAKFVFGCLAAFAGLLLFLVFCGWAFRPALSRQQPAFAQVAVAEAQARRNPILDPENPPVFYREADYSEGPNAAWFPKRESPLLEELVRTGQLRPVAERTGTEPVVLEGIEGTGRYGGTWIIAAGASVYPTHIGSRLSAASLLRWSPEGFPIVPHVAKSYEVRDGHREFVFHLRKGMRWSDGHPFSADDILYWWEFEASDEAIQLRPPDFMLIHGRVGTVEKVDEHTVRFRFPEPNGIFLQEMATGFGAQVVGSPAHYLKPYHPRAGDGALIEPSLRAMNLPGARALYTKLKTWNNPEHPRLWPWIYRTYKTSPPQVFVRNPNYFAVDTNGNQLPYIDRILMNEMTRDMATVAASNGEVSMQWGLRLFYQYSRLMTLHEKNGFDVYHWSNGHGTLFSIVPNLNRRIDPSDPATAKKKALLNRKEFRQALSLALDRKEIIRAEFSDLTEPAQVAPGPDSPFFNASLYHAFTDYDPDRANRMLDSLGLGKRDREGYRTFADSTRMTFHLIIATTQKPDRVENVLDHWAQVGIRVSLRALGGNLSPAVRSSRDFDLVYTGLHGQILPLLNPYMYVPVDQRSLYAIGYGNWYKRGGFFDHPDAETKGALEPPLDHPLRRTMEIYERAIATPHLGEQAEIFSEILEIAAENLWSINISTSPPVLAVVKNGFHNVPRFVLWTSQFQSLGNAGLETYFFARGTDSEGAVKQTQEALLRVDRFPKLAGFHAAERRDHSKFQPGPWLRRLLLILGVASVVYLGVRMPYVGRWLLIMIPTLAVISVIVFVIIQLPPGDYLTFLIAQLEESGEVADEQRIDEVREMFLPDRSWPQRDTTLFDNPSHWPHAADRYRQTPGPAES